MKLMKNGYEIILEEADFSNAALKWQTGEAYERFLAGLDACSKLDWHNKFLEGIPIKNFKEEKPKFEF